MKNNFISVLIIFILSTTNLFSAGLFVHNTTPSKKEIENALANKDLLPLFQAIYKIAALSPQGIRNYDCVCFYKGFVMPPRILDTIDKTKGVFSTMAGCGDIDKISDADLAAAGFKFIHIDGTRRLLYFNDQVLPYDHYKFKSRCVIFFAGQEFVAREEAAAARWTALREAWTGGVVRGGWLRAAHKQPLVKAGKKPSF